MEIFFLNENCEKKKIKADFIGKLEIYEEFTCVEVFSLKKNENSENSKNFENSENLKDFSDLQFFAGLKNGNLVFFKFLTKEKKFSKMKKILIFKEPINRIKNYSEGLFIIGEKKIKIFDFLKKKIISGGSLNSRLENSEILENFFFCEKKKFIFLFTNLNKMLIFLYKKKKIIFFFEKKFPEKIIYSNFIKSNLFIGTKKNLEIYKILKNSNPLNFFLTGKIDKNFIINFPKKKIENFFSSFFIDKINLFIYIGDEIGNIFIFDLKNGFFLSSLEIHISKIFKFQFFEKKNWLLTFSENEGKIFKIGFLDPKDEERNYRNGYKNGSF